MRGATAAAFGTMRWHGISIHAPRAGRDDGSLNIIAVKLDISIHAPHAGRDRARPARRSRPTNFNPRAPCGARRIGGFPLIWEQLFQSTRPMRGATPWSPATPPRWNHFNPRAPCRARLVECLNMLKGAEISIHAPRAGRDALRSDANKGERYFNPRAPCRARLLQMPFIYTTTIYFNPRAPCRARPPNRGCSASPETFQSTRPVQGATASTW